MAINELNINILAEGDFYECDLLKAVLTSDTKYWGSRQNEWKQMCDIVDRNQKVLEENDTTDFIKNGWLESIKTFKNKSNAY